MKNQMKVLLTGAVAVLVSLFALSSCQVAQLIIDGTTYYETEIYTKDNRMVAGRIGGQRSAKLASGSKKISIKTANGRERIKSEEIAYMTLARKNHPEKQQTLVYTDFRYPYTRKGVQKFRTFKCWQIVNHAGDHLLITASGRTYHLAKDGGLVITYSSDEGIKYCIRRQGDESPVYIGRSISGRAYMRKQWQDYLADDPVLCRKIADKEIDAFDFAAIAEQYNPMSNRAVGAENERSF